MTKYIFYKIFGCHLSICYDDLTFEEIIKFIYPYYVQKANVFPQYRFFLKRIERNFIVQLNGKEELRTNYIEELFSFLEWNITCLALKESNQFLQLHAGCIAREGEGIILIGKTGAGKTTLVYHLLKKALLCLSDDILFVSLDKGILYPFRRTFLIKTGLQKMINLTEDSFTKEDNKIIFSNNRAYFDPETEFKSCWSQPISKVRAVILINYCDTKNFIKVQKYLAAEEMLKASFNLNYVKNRACKVTADILNNSKTYYLHSNDIEWSVSRVCSIFDG